MLGAIVGDVIGSVYEADNLKTPYFYPLFDERCRFTDDTVLTVAIADAILHQASYQDKLKEYFRRYPHAGYGGRFIHWAMSDSQAPYNSWGNGSAMRVSPVAYSCSTLEEVLAEARRTAVVTHSHFEGIKGAQATAASIFLARTGSDKEAILEYVQSTFDYDLTRSLDMIRPNYKFDVSCQGSVPEAIIAFLESDNFEDAIRKAISLGGDSDTIACIAGGIAEAYYGEVPEEIQDQAWEHLDNHLRDVVTRFCEKQIRR